MKTTEGSLAHTFLLVSFNLKVIYKNFDVNIATYGILEIRFITAKKHRDLVMRTLSNLFLIIVGQVVDLAQIHL